MFQKNVVEKIKKHIICSITFFENHAVSEIMWKNTVEPDRMKMTIWHMCMACWTPKAKNPYSE
jgi:hypothetical protein